MANFEIERKRVSEQTRIAQIRLSLNVKVWGYVPGLEVAVDPANSVTIIEGIIYPDPSKQHQIREYTLTPTISKFIRVMAKVNNTEWDWFKLDVINSGSFKNLTQEQQNFIEDLTVAGKEVARQYGYPLSAMIACACVESKFGLSEIYKTTKSPFNLQKPQGDPSKHEKKWYWPKCDIVLLPTISKHGQTNAAPAPFCKAKDLKDAARLFCEWIDHYPGDGETPQECSDPTQKQRAALLAYRNNPQAFAENLCLVGFADHVKERYVKGKDGKDHLVGTKLFGQIWTTYELGRFDEPVGGPAVQPPAPQYPAPSQEIESEDTLGLLLNQDGELVPPNAPRGGGGPGYFCSTGVLCGYPYVQDLPHPGAPGPLNVDMLAIRDFEKDRDEG